MDIVVIVIIISFDARYYMLNTIFSYSSDF